MVDFIAGFKSAQKTDRILDGRLINHHRLKTALQSGIFLDMLAVLVKRGCADTVQLATCQHWFQHIRGIHRTLSCTSTDESMQFINKQDNATFCTGDFLEYSFQALLKLTSELGPCHQCTEVKRYNLLISKSFRNIATHNTLGQTFDNGSFSNARFTDEYGIVLSTSAQYLDHTPDFLIAPDDRVKLPLAC